MRDIRVASVQFEHAPGDKSANFARIEAFADRAADAGAEIVVFPECCITGYWWMRHLDRAELEALAEPVFDGPSSQRLTELARSSGRL